ncbi:MAG: GTP 3',8-cyclase MoaA [Gammaproteobacteria bacterium]|nr:GTP 3',8-cyclase MoaA [Gammaproteobacteria bacterium]MBU2678150.1 GTP 3',8-cyclase MoaA [Gammaproteobacteria bacterium]NNC57425.1 GTP 3',8-cyclase MoaA [Woeseiaceae bacterium]NNL51885.1 GTP 3',8-cyclase MoaA [Woeseiaceae bacterium]
MSSQPKSDSAPRTAHARTRDALGRPLHDLRISLLDQCNFRCPYCMPEDEFHADYEFLRKQQRLTYDEILRVARVATRLGVSKIRLTGGEPLLDKNLAELVAGLAELPGVDDLALTTNGMLLAPLADQLAGAGLHRVTISLDSLDETVFKRMSGGRGDMKKVLAGIDAAEAAGLSPIKINVVVQRGVNDHTVLDLLDHFRGSEHVVRLIEFMDVGNRNGWRMDQVVPSRDLLEQVVQRWPLRRVDKNYPGEVARRYKYVDGQGEIGFISSVTEPFCGGCSRARLSADGVLYTCLFASQGTDLRESLRNDADEDELTDILSRIWLQRADRYSELRSPELAEAHMQRKVEMYRIGG